MDGGAASRAGFSDVGSAAGGAPTTRGPLPASAAVGNRGVRRRPSALTRVPEKAYQRGLGAAVAGEDGRVVRVGPSNSSASQYDWRSPGNRGAGRLRTTAPSEAAGHLYTTTAATASVRSSRTTHGQHALPRCHSAAVFMEGKRLGVMCGIRPQRSNGDLRSPAGASRGSVRIVVLGQ